MARWAVLAMATALAGCGVKPYVEGSGEVEGYSMSPQTIWWGSSYIVMTNKELDCMDMSWVSRYYAEGESPVDYDLTALQFNFSGGEVFSGYFEVSGTAAVTGWWLVSQDGGFSYYRARSGTLQISEMTDDDIAVGEFALQWDSGSADGTFAAEYCTNIK